MIGNRSIGNKSNLKDWADYAKGNSYHPDKAELKANLNGSGRAGRDDTQPEAPKVKTSEGRGWAKAKATTSDNTYTGPGGSKRD